MSIFSEMSIRMENAGIHIWSNDYQIISINSFKLIPNKKKVCDHENVAEND